MRIKYDELAIFKTNYKRSLPMSPENTAIVESKAKPTHKAIPTHKSTKRTEGRNQTRRNKGQTAFLKDS